MAAFHYPYYSEVETGANGKKRRYYLVPCEGVPCDRRGNRKCKGDGFRKVQRTDIGRASRCPICQRSIAGKAGFAALVEKLGSRGTALEFLAGQMRQQQLDKPSKPERDVMAEFDKANLCYVRQYFLTADDGHVYAVDFLVLGGQRVAVEVDGGYWHTLPDAQRRDAAKRALLEKAGIPLVTVAAHELSQVVGKVEAVRHV